MFFERVHVLNHLKNAKLSVQSSKDTKLHPRRESPISPLHTIYISLLQNIYIT